MSAATKAVFISYAREDLAAARRIADALGAFEVEVWFDQDGLEGGDAWDQKIRRQIRECALFIAVVSASTEARREAYFRLEWKLAEERTHLMAEGTSFLLPIAIDGTLEKAALVPESFRRAQWMRLPRGVPNTQFVDRVRGLLENQRRSPSPRADDAHTDSRPSRPGKKWVLVAAVVALGFAASIPFWSKRDAVPPAARSVPALADKSIAVLPFTNMSDDKENGFFTDGIHEDILTNLANIADLKVIARTSVMQYRETRKTIRQIGDELGVAYVLEGSVRRVGNTVRVTGQLIDVRTQGHVWANRYDREFELKEIFATQSALATQIVTALRAALTPADKARLARPPTDNPAAYDLYSRARAILRSQISVRDQVGQAQVLLDQAVTLDPNFALAWLQLSGVHGRAYNTFDKTAARDAQVKACIDTAERLAPDDPNVIIGVGNYYFRIGDIGRAREIYERVVRDLPNNADALVALSYLQRREDRWAEALAALRRARALDPRGPETASHLYRLFSELRRYDDMEKLVREEPSLNPTTTLGRYSAALRSFNATGSTEEVNPYVASLALLLGAEADARMVTAQWAFTKGDASEVIRLWQEAGPSWRFSQVFGRLDLLAVAMSFLKLGRPAEARPLLEKNRDILRADLVVQPTNQIKQRDLVLTYALLGDKVVALELLSRLEISAKVGIAGLDLAVIHTWLGQKPDAVAVLQSVLTHPDAPSFGSVHALRHSLNFWPLQGDPAFEALLNDPKNNAPLL